MLSELSSTPSQHGTSKAVNTDTIEAVQNTALDALTHPHEVLTTLFEWASLGWDDSTLKPHLLSILHPDAQSGIKDMIRFNWPRFERQWRDYLVDENDFQVLRW